MVPNHIRYRCFVLNFLRCSILALQIFVFLYHFFAFLSLVLKKRYRFFSSLCFSIPSLTLVRLIMADNNGTSGDAGRGKREDRLNINFLLNEQNVSPRPSAGRDKHPVPSTFSLGSSTAAGAMGMQRNICSTCGHLFSSPADLRKHISTGTTSALNHIHISVLRN